MKRVDEAILEQNMAHNMAHENIAQKLDELTRDATINAQSLQRSPDLESISDDLTNRLVMAESNITTLFSSNRQFLNQVRSLEDSDMSILSRIAELRNVRIQCGVIFLSVPKLTYSFMFIGPPKRQFHHAK
jgi:hypothetical protein